MVNSNCTDTFIILPAFSKGREGPPVYPGGGNFFINLFNFNLLALIDGHSAEIR